jgi:hypothetical protein
MCAPGPTPSLFSFRLILRGLEIEEVEEVDFLISWRRFYFIDFMEAILFYFILFDFCCEIS